LMTQLCVQSEILGQKGFLKLLSDEEEFWMMSFYSNCPYESSFSLIKSMLLLLWLEFDQ
jgi:hypothetical protein